MARRTFADYKAEVRHALGSPADADMDILSGTIVNDALQHLATLHPWRWLITGPQTLSVVAGQNYVELPADFGQLESLSHDGWDQRMTPTTWGHMLALRGDPIAAWTGGYWYTISTGNVEAGDEDAGLTLPTLELYPTPATSAADALAIVYRRLVRPLENADDRPQIPIYLDRPLSLLARGFARVDYEDEPESAYTQSFRALISDAMTMDGLSVGSFGIGRSGVKHCHNYSPFYPSHIPDPTSS